jgi:hypothetical protein
VIPAKTLHQNLNRRLNRISSDFQSHFTVDEKDFFINQAIEIYQENITGIAETNSRIRESLRTLLFPDIELTKIDKNEQYATYEYPKDFYRRERAYAFAKSKDCSESRIIDIVIIQRDDLNKVIDDIFWNVSFEWAETFAVESHEGILVYHQNEMILQKVFIDYYKEIPKVYFPSGIEPQGCYTNPYTGEILTEDQGLELVNNYQMRKILDIAALLMRASRGDSIEFQLELSKIFNVEKLYLN